MSDGKLVDLGLGGAEPLQVYAASAIEARFLYEEIFREGCYADMALPDRPLVLDVGANIGMFVLYVKRRYPDAEVHAFEPAPVSVALLRRNIELHGLDRVTVHDTALGSVAERDVPFVYYPMIPGNSTRYPEIKQLQKTNMTRLLGSKVVERMHRGEWITTSVRRLSEFLAGDRRVDLLKIDAEGAEVDVLRGIDPAHWPLIGQVLLEVQDLADRLAAACGLLREHGLEPVVLPAPLIDEENRAYLVRAARP
jgi:FkbM family methyltransferase